MAGQLAKYEKIVEWITERITNGDLPEGSKIYSENELVSMFQVSRQTVRHAISVLTERGLVISKRGSGTYVKEKEDGLADMEKTMRIAVMLTYVDEYIFPALIQGIEQSLAKEGYNLQLTFTYNTVERERVILNGYLKEGKIDGIIAEPVKSGIPNPNLEIYRKLRKKRVPMVFVNANYPGLESIHVSLDDFWAGKTAAEHLLQCGHRKIGGIFKLDDGQGHKRYAGYIEALMEQDIKINQKHIIWIDTVDFYEMEKEAERYVRRLEGCTACVCYNDEVAAKLVKICKVKGIDVPEQLSIVGIDNSELAGYADVPITSVNNPVIELGVAAAKSLLQMLEGKKVTENLELKSKLVVRNSTRIIDYL